jgi:hypothetical protein
VDRPLSENLRTHSRSNLYTLFIYSEAQRKFVALHLVLVMLEKLLDSVKEWGRYGVFFGRGFNVR